MDERTILRKTKGVLLERGWHQGGFSSDGFGGGPVCLAGAAKVAVFGNPYDAGRPLTRPEKHALGGAYLTLMDAIGSGLRSTIPAWNDKPGRTVDEVIALIDRALGSLPAEAPEPEKEPVHG